MYYNRYYHHIVFLLLCCLPFTTKAQIYIGVEAGATLTQSRLSDSEFSKLYDAMPGPGWKAGLQVLFLPNELLGLQTGVAYSVKRKITRNTYHHDEVNDATLSYIDVPVIFRYEFQAGSLKTYIGLGPEMGFWLGGRGRSERYDPMEGETILREYTIHFGSYDNAADRLNVQEANRMQLGFAFATGFYVEDQKHNRIAVDLRLSLGQTHLASGSGAEIPSGGVRDSYLARNKTLSCTVTYLFSTRYQPYRMRR